MMGDSFKQGLISEKNLSRVNGNILLNTVSPFSIDLSVNLSIFSFCLDFTSIIKINGELGFESSEHRAGTSF